MTAGLFELSKIFFKVGLATFGGGLASIPFLHDAFVVTRPWITEGAFTDMLSVAQMTPGPIVLNLTTLLGYTYGGGFFGALISTFVMLLGPLVVVTILMLLLQKSTGKTQQWIDRCRFAMKPVIAALLVSSLWSVTRPIVNKPQLWPLTALSLILLIKSKFFKAYPQLVMVLCGLITLTWAYVQHS